MPAQVTREEMLGNVSDIVVNANLILIAAILKTLNIVRPQLIDDWLVFRQVLTQQNVRKHNCDPMIVRALISDLTRPIAGIHDRNIALICSKSAT